LSYEGLSRHLNDDQPVYGLQAVPEDAAGPISIETLARRYVREIRGVQPNGPYRLAGWSAGGLIAYEMAHQLLGENEQVEFLGLIDSRTGHEAGLEPMPDEEQLAWGMLLVILRNMCPGLDESALSDLKSMGSVAAVVEQGKKMGWFPPGIAIEELSWRTSRARHLSMACTHYVPQFSPIPLSLFTADLLESEDASLGWASIAGGGLRIERIGGTHLSIMEEPLIGKLAVSIERALAQTEQNG
jgi:thioesterase domain-containing protein